MSIDHIIAVVLADIALVIVVARVMGRLFRALRQPAVVGEIVGGILLGPTLLGAFPGHLDTVLFPPPVRPYLLVLAQLGLVLFMFIVGLELNLRYVSGHLRIASSVSLASIALPFTLGCLCAALFYTRHNTVDGHPVPLTALALFLGIALSITAFPVLARILTERGMHFTPVGVLSLACAAIDDVAAWALLALVVAVTTGNGPAQVLTTIALTVAFALVMLLGVRPLLARLVDRRRRAGRLTPDIMAIVLVGLLASAWVTNAIGVHVIFGAFLFGAAMPRAGAEALNHEILERLEHVSVLLLLPIFFVITGLNVDVGALGLGGLAELALILAVAILGKFVGAAAAARVSHVPRRQSLALGALMNTRGLTELVILQVGRQLGVLDTGLFTILVLMAVVTTMMTEPLLRWIYPPRMVRRDIAAAERHNLGYQDTDTVIVAIDDPDHAAGQVQLAAQLARPDGRVVLARYITRRPGATLEVGTGLGAELGQVAGALQAVHELATQAQPRDTRVVCRYSDDPAADLTTLATELGADVVIATHNGAQGLERRPWTVVVPPPDADLVAAINAVGAPVSVRTDLSPDGRAALKIGTRLGAHGHRCVQVIPLDAGRRGLAHRWRAIGEALKRADVQAELVNGAPRHDGVGVVVSPISAPHPPGDAVVVRVRAGDADAEADFEETVEAIATSGN